MRSALVLSLLVLLALVPSAQAVPYCPIDGVELCSEHGSDAIRRTWLDAEAGGAHACVLVKTDHTRFIEYGAATCGLDTGTALGGGGACLDTAVYTFLADTDACLSHEAEATGTTEACYQGTIIYLLRVDHVHEGCFAHADAATGSTSACWDRWDGVYAGVVLSWGSACFEHADPVTGTTRVEDDADRFTNGALQYHAGGTRVSTEQGDVDASLDGTSVFAAFNDWRTSGNVTTLASWGGSASSDPFTMRASAAACLRASDARVCLP